MTKVEEKKEISEEKKSARLLFTDNWNSFWHIIFGLFAVKIKILVPIFILYQFLDKEDENVFVDVYEFICGYTAGLVFLLT